MLKVPADPEGWPVTPISIAILLTLNVAAEPVGVTRAVPVTVEFPMLNVPAEPVGVKAAVPVTVKLPALNVAADPLGDT